MTRWLDLTSRRVRRCRCIVTLDRLGCSIYVPHEISQVRQQQQQVTQLPKSSKSLNADGNHKITTTITREKKQQQQITKRKSCCEKGLPAKVSEEKYLSILQLDRMLRDYCKVTASFQLAPGCCVFSFTVKLNY